MGPRRTLLQRQPVAAPRRSSFSLSLKTCFNALALGLALSVPAHAAKATSPATQTTYSQSVESLNRQFANAGPYDKIIFLDRDDIARRIAATPLSAGDHAAPKAVESFVYERTGYRLPYRYSMSLADTIRSGAGQALPVPYVNARGQEAGLCIVAGHNPDATAEEQQKKIMGIAGPVKPLRSMTSEQVKKFTDYHELGHCADKTYLPASLKEKDEAKIKLLTHKAELYAEVFAVLMLARDGHADLAGLRADQRLVNTALHGTSHLYTYALHGGLRLAQAEIDRLGADKIRQMPVTSIAVLSRSIAARDDASPTETDHEKLAETLRPQIEAASLRLFGRTIAMPQNPLNITSDMARVAILSHRLNAEGETERDIIHNATLEKERLRAISENLPLTEEGVAASRDLMLMTAAMREAILESRRVYALKLQRENVVPLKVASKTSYGDGPPVL